MGLRVYYLGLGKKYFLLHKILWYQTEASLAWVLSVKFGVRGERFGHSFILCSLVLPFAHTGIDDVGEQEKELFLSATA